MHIGQPGQHTAVETGAPQLPQRAQPLRSQSCNERAVNALVAEPLLCLGDVVVLDSGTHGADGAGLRAVPRRVLTERYAAAANHVSGGVQCEGQSRQRIRTREPCHRSDFGQ